MQDIESQTLALAGTIQAAALVEQLAKQGNAPSKAIQPMLSSIFITNPKSAVEIYDNVNNLEMGLGILKEILHRYNSTKNPDCIRYTLSLLHLQKKLSKNSAMLNVLSDRISRCEQQLNHFDVLHENIVANLADIYADTLSTFAFRIQVRGSFDYLQQPRIANQIRALLLAGVRSVTLWRQVGGNRIQLMINRNKLYEASDLLYQSTKQL
jgi:high frequency lysogenization protein